MRILLVTHRYPPLGVTGVERLSEQTAQTLQAAGHAVTVLTRDDRPTPQVPRLLHTTRDGVDVLIAAGGGPAHGRFPKLTSTFERVFERTLIEVTPDIVLISHLINHSPGYVAVAHRWDVPVVLELHDFFVACERAHLQRVSGELCPGPDRGRACAMFCYPQDARATERWALRTHMFRLAIEHADALVCPSNFVAQYFRDLYGPSIPPLHVIGNGVDVGLVPPRTRRSSGPLHLACVGAVAQHKGVHVLLDALSRARLPEARLTLIGEVFPPYLLSIREQAEQIENLELRAYGRFRPVELPSLLSDVDAVVIPSVVWESYSIVAREAMSCGVPVVAARLGALPEAIRHGENGLLFEAGSTFDLAAKIRLLAADRERLNGLSAGIRATDWISVEERTHRLQAVLEDALRSPVPQRRPGRELGELSVLRDALAEPALEA